MSPADQIRPIRWQNEALELLDQRRLPAEECYLRLEEPEAVATAIADMVVRGAPAIGITAAFGMALAARRVAGKVDWRESLNRSADLLRRARPTAVNLGWAVEQQLHNAGLCDDATTAGEQLLHWALDLLAQDIWEPRFCRRRAVSSPTATPAVWPPAASAPPWG